MTGQKYSRIAQAVMERPWAILPSYLGAIVEVLEFRMAGGRLSDEEMRERIGSPDDPMDRYLMLDAELAAVDVGAAMTAAADGASPTRGAIAVLPLVGVIHQRANLMSMSSTPGVSLERFGALLRQATEDPRVSAIVIDVDSPGGEVGGTPEAGDQVRAARTKKPVVAVANTLSASAAYWIASQAGELVVSPSAEVGSIGVWAAHTEFSKMDEAAGVTTTIVRAGKYKYELNEFEPLTEEARGALQARIDDYYGMFLQAVAKGRGVSAAKVRDEFGEGRVVGAKDAVRLGMADRIGTLQETIDRVAKGQVGVGRQALAADAVGEDPRLAISAEELASLPLAERMAEYQRRLTAGELTPNQVRRAENMSPIEGGDEPFDPYQHAWAIDQVRHSGGAEPTVGVEEAADIVPVPDDVAADTTALKTEIEIRRRRARVR